MSTSPRRALFWSLAERCSGLVISIGSTMLLSRLLTPAQVGIYSMCAAFTAVAGILRDFGVSEYLIQEKDLTRDKIRSAYAVAFIVAWSIGALAFFGRHALADFYAEPRVAEVMLVLTLHFLLLPISSPTFALMNRELAFRPIFFMQMACNAAQAATSVVLAYMGYGVLSLAWGPIVNVAVQTVILGFLRPQEIRHLPSLSQIRPVLRFGSMFVTSRSLEVITRNIHEPVIAKYFDFASVGIFSRAFGLLELFHANIATAIIRVATPAFAASHRAGESLGAQYLRGTAIFTSVSWSFFSFVAIASEYIIRVMFGQQWIAAAPLASILAITALPHGLTAMAPQLMAATGNIGKRLKVTMITSPIHFLAVMVAVQHSLSAVALCWLVSNTVTVLLYRPHLAAVMQLKFRQILISCLPSAMMAAVSTSLEYLVLRLPASAQFPPLMILIASFVAGALGWLASGWILNHPSHQEIRQFVNHSSLGRFLNTR